MLSFMADLPRRLSLLQARPQVLALLLAVGVLGGLEPENVALSLYALTSHVACFLYTVARCPNQHDTVGKVFNTSENEGTASPPATPELGWAKGSESSVAGTSGAAASHS